MESRSCDVPTLFTLCARNISENVARLEPAMCDLPTAVLQELLHFLNIYDLERIEEIAVNKSISTQAFWHQIWKDVIGTNPKAKIEPVNWRQKFLQTFFHGVLWGTLDTLSDRRLYNSRSAALFLASRHVSKLVIRNKLQGVKEIADNPSICRRLACTVHKLVFQHLRSADQMLQHSLLTLLHSLIHHGIVKELILSHWNEPHPELLALLLKTSAGLWHAGKREHQCVDCCDEDRLKMNIKAKYPTDQRSTLDFYQQEAGKTALSDGRFGTTDNSVMSAAINIISDDLISQSSHHVTYKEITHGDIGMADESSSYNTCKTHAKKCKSCLRMYGPLTNHDAHSIDSDVKCFSEGNGRTLAEAHSSVPHDLYDPTSHSNKTCESNCCSGQQIIKGQLYPTCRRVMEEIEYSEPHHTASEESASCFHEAESRTYKEPKTYCTVTGTLEKLVCCKYANVFQKYNSVIVQEYSSEEPRSPSKSFGEFGTNAHNGTSDELYVFHQNTLPSEHLSPCYTNKKLRLTDVCNFKSAENPKTNQRLPEEFEKQGDIYDYIFMLGKNKANSAQNTSGTDEDSDCLMEQSDLGFTGEEQANETLLPSPELYVRSVSVLEITSVSLSYSSAVVLSRLLSSWVSLQKLVLEYNGLGPAIFLILKGLYVLSCCHSSCLSTLVLKDDILHLPLVKLLKIIIGIFPHLQTFHLRFLLEIRNESLENQLLIDIPEITGSCLKDLSLSCTDVPLQVDVLLTVLKELKFLKRLNLHKASFSPPEQLGKLLHATTFSLPMLEWITIEDVNLAVCFKEVLDLLRNAPLRGLTLENCRLFENHMERVSEIVNALKQNQFLRVLSLPANRLGNKGLLLLAKLFTEESLSCVSCLDVSANCIRGDGLFEFASFLMRAESEMPGRLKLKELNVSENLFFRDPALTQEALKVFKNKCHVITVQSLTDPLQALADHSSVM
ncbi:leucine-rich repeat-containing protein 41 isoform X1 [Hypanus sabinus]|uniref:leucine-rich repeat-containing protein 41 isoform X1 n=1 Tax=Hypanus sabinus TaxID=79690 RepID=UPI0028C3DFA5|nr:leucine-rich repeat-containing protein 41 isoform X1 [Hypanus sabinus]